MFVEPLVRIYRALISEQETKIRSGTRRRPKEDKRKRGALTKGKVDLKV